MPDFWRFDTMTIRKNTIISLKFVNFRPKIYLIAYLSFESLTIYIASTRQISRNLFIHSMYNKNLKWIQDTATSNGFSGGKGGGSQKVLMQAQLGKIVSKVASHSLNIFVSTRNSFSFVVARTLGGFKSTIAYSRVKIEAGFKIDGVQYRRFETPSVNTTWKWDCD